MTHIFFGLTQEENKTEELKKRILKGIFITTIIALIPFVVLSYLRSEVVGHLTLIFWEELIMLFVMIFFVYDKTISYKVKSNIYQAAVLIITTTGLYYFGLLSSAKIVFLFISLLSVTYLNLRWGIVYLIIISVCFVGIGYLYVNGFIVSGLGEKGFTSNYMNWVQDGFTLLFVIVSSGLITGLLLKGYKTEVRNLRKSEKVLFQTIQQLPLSTILVDDNLEVIYSNTKFKERTGLSIEKGMDIFQLFNILKPSYVMGRKENQEILKKDLLEIFSKGVIPPIKEITYLDKNKIQRWSEVHINMVEGDLMLLMFVDVTDRKQKRKEIIEAMVNAEENERGRMAKELHDGLGPLVSTSKIYAQSLSKITDKAKKEEYVARLVQILDDTLNEVRNISNNISPHILRNYGLKDAVQSFIDKLKPVSDIQFQIKYDANIQLSQTFEFTIYRTLVEMVNNSIKYAQAQNISIFFTKLNEFVEIRYTDDGQGFDLEKQKNKGFGLTNMESRIVNLGASYEFNTSPGNGVEVIIKIQCNGTENCIG